MNLSRVGWYGRRLARMSPGEVGWRVSDEIRRAVWARRRFGPATPPSRISRRWLGPDGRASAARAAAPFPARADLSSLPEPGRRALLSAAEGLLAGRLEILGVERDDMTDPTWSRDPVSGRTYPEDRCAFSIDYRDPHSRRNVKQVWELSRHHHLTVLATAWRLTGDDRYASTIARHLRSWWRANPVLVGVNWCSGIELGIRLVSWVWVRRLLDGWAGAPELFERNDAAVRQVYWHQRYLSAFRSRGSSANNHVVAEAAGLLVSSCALPWFAESERWRSGAASVLAEELERNTFPDGLDREQAFDYHGLVAELGLVAAAEAEAAGTPLGDGTWDLLCRMLDDTAAVVDRAGRAPRYGDGDDGRALVVTDPGADRWQSLLAVGAAVFGPRPWWPTTTPDAQSVLLAALVGRTVGVGPRPEARPSHFAASGLTLLRSPPGDDEIWCRCDGGPHGFLSIAAHAHADALSVELRHGGVEVLVDPGTYCYHDEPDWRRYFRSTLAHNTLEIDGQDQSVSGGPFLWARAARTHVLAAAVDPCHVQRWSAEHDGYARLDPPARHRRAVTLDPAAGSLEIVDDVATVGSHDLRLAFHLGVSVEAEVDGATANLRWRSPTGGQAGAVLSLPDELAWSSHRGSTDPLLGWYSPAFGRRQPTTTLLGTATASSTTLRSRLQFSATSP